MPINLLQFQSYGRLILLASTVLRMGGALVILVMMAAYLPASAVGVISFGIAVGVLMSALADAGQATFILRRIGISPAFTSSILWRSLVVKTAASIACLPVGLASLFFFSGEGNQSSVGAICALLSVVTMSFSELLSQAMRARKEYAREFLATLISFLTSVGVMWVIIARTSNVSLVGAALLMSRGLSVIVTVVCGWNIIEPERWRLSKLRRLPLFFRSGLPYAAEPLFVALSSQIDVILLMTFLSAADVGVYQSAARFNQAVAPIASIIAITQIAGLASLHRRQSSGYAQAEVRMGREFGAAAAVTLLGFVFGGPLISHYVYGDRFPETLVLWPAMGVAGAMRLLSAAYSVSLTALGCPKLLAVPRLASVLVLASTLFLFSSTYGLKVMPLALLSSSYVLLLGNGALYTLTTWNHKTLTITTLIAAALVAVFVVTGHTRGIF